MPHSGSKVKFVQCTAEEYNSLPVKDEDTIYFLVDNHALRINDTVYFNITENDTTEENQ